MILCRFKSLESTNLLEPEIQFKLWKNLHNKFSKLNALKECKGDNCNLRIWNSLIIVFAIFSTEASTTFY